MNKILNLLKYFIRISRGERRLSDGLLLNINFLESLISQYTQLNPMTVDLEYYETEIEKLTFKLFNHISEPNVSLDLKMAYNDIICSIIDSKGSEYVNNEIDQLTKMISEIEIRL